MEAQATATAAAAAAAADVGVTAGCYSSRILGCCWVMVPTCS
jgi:hypothetical protein